MANFDSNYYTNGPKVRAAGEQPEWFSFTVTIPAGTALADSDVLRFAKFGANQKILAYALGCDASLGTANLDEADIVIGSTEIDGAVEADALGTADRTYNAVIAVAHVTADGDILKLETENSLNSQTSTGDRKVTLSVLVAQQNNRDSARLFTFPDPATT